ncbi:RNA polymerase I-specific transcription initiation factor RRN3 [Scheffersomyces xylosifermentans]|uniref:RNA polymerase I-specific transcription initiation factor RRN3 n=1 Tax=Scheffersomyces xylosifermentans TaxID=1304137 RepID=UPI00315CF06B
MIMSLHEPITRKRTLPSTNPKEASLLSKKLKMESKDMAQDSNDTVFSEKMYSTYVKSALESMDKNDPAQINTLTDKISLPPAHKESISLLHFNIVLNSLISNISKLDNKSCRSLISAILDYQWLEIKEAAQDKDIYNRFIDLYSHFLSVLVSSFPKYLQDVTNKLIFEFGMFNPTQTERKITHHEILSKIVRYIPTCINSLPQTLQRNFPHHLSSSTTELTNYVANLMKIREYCPEIQFNTWQLIVECCIKLDVELQNELDDIDDDEIEDLINGDDDDQDDDDDGEDDEDDIDVDGTIDPTNDDNEDGEDGEIQYMLNPVNSTDNIKALSSKLDSIIGLLLTTTSTSFTEEELNNLNGVNLFNTITSLFKSHILPTHFTKSIQFVMFHISQYQPELADSFLVLLIDVAFNPNEILEKRLKAMQYLSSYIARAKNLSRHQVVFIVSYLIGWLNKYIIERECEIADFESNVNSLNNGSKTTGGMERFKLFYAAFQALLYIFCFRHKLLVKNGDGEVSSLAESSSDSEWECDLDKFIQRVILAKFNPLKFCDETVVYIFAKIAAKLNVCYCYSIIEHNKRERMLQTNGQAGLPSAVGNFKSKQEFLDLEAYFPFDPLVLPFCKKIVSKNYVEWSEVNPSNEDDDDEDDSGSGSHREEDGDSDDQSSSESEDDMEDDD